MVSRDTSNEPPRQCRVLLPEGMYVTDATRPMCGGLCATKRMCRTLLEDGLWGGALTCGPRMEHRLLDWTTGRASDGRPAAVTDVKCEPLVNLPRGVVGAFGMSASMTCPRPHGTRSDTPVAVRTISGSTRGIARPR